ncbi:hypothetical protein [Phocaeicola dorei]|uniref:hypothetical protein n=1 Tax=Phocaeicola dorei TaxID=357276 RepID=UPI0034A4E96D
MKKKKYEAPLTEYTQVELENGFMSASMFEDVNKHDEGVSINGHEIGNSGNYFDSNSENQEWNQWD